MTLQIQCVAHKCFRETHWQMSAGRPLYPSKESVTCCELGRFRSLIGSEAHLSTKHAGTTASRAFIKLAEAWDGDSKLSSMV